MFQPRNGLLYPLLIVALSALALACSSDSADPTPGSNGSGGGDAGDPPGTGGGVTIVDGGTSDASDAGCVLADGAPCRYEEVDAGPQCGDGQINQPGEECDDENRLAGDGCSGACKVEPFFDCPAEGGPCTPTMVCGDNEVTGIEECDDGNTEPGDGCSARCYIEASYYDCPPTGGPCVSTAACGNGQIEPGENCDDGNPTGGDGCSADCQVELGWNCRMPGAHCTPNCGDGSIMAGAEECDDGNQVTGDGCSSSCRIEPGFMCSAPAGGASICTATVCGDGVREGTELCDLGVANGLFYGDGNGCSRACTPEPLCRPAGGGPTGACTSQCGDGMRVAGEGCDDGNLTDGDGCSTGCVVEPGFTCNDVPQSDVQPCSAGGGQCLLLPIIFRDFNGQGQPNGHPDFFYVGQQGISGTTYCVPEASCDPPAVPCVDDQTARCLNLVMSQLNDQGKPAFNASRPGGNLCDCHFQDWDHTGVVAGVPGAHQENQYGTDYWVFEAPVPIIRDAASFAQWFTDSSMSTALPPTTLELSDIGGGQYQFSSSGGRTITDDIHDQVPLTSGFFPEGPGATVCNLWPYWIDWPNCQGNQWDPYILPDGAAVPATGMQRNNYFTSEVRYLFFYRDSTDATLTFFGDDDVWVFINGILAVDLGATHQQLQGSVTIDSTTASQFGLSDGNIYEIAVFHADRHPNDSNYQLTLSGFVTDRSDCYPTCGDGVASIMEECDEGAANNDTAYGGCRTDCTFGPFCGDGIVNGPEQCDDGVNTTVGYGLTGCAPGCVPPPRCGDGTIDASEECDDGEANQDGTDGGCSSTCTRNPHCGDGVVIPEHGEECDHGEGNAPPDEVEYGGCTTECKLGPHCGDGILQQPPEGCDDGNTEDQDGCSSICIHEVLIE